MNQIRNFIYTYLKLQPEQHFFRGRNLEKPTSVELHFNCRNSDMASDNASEPQRPSKPQYSGAPPPEQENLPCPRCDSTHTKFCYYNNYNFSQPRHFCKSCRRYWTQGGTLRDIPIGGGSRRNAKRSRTPSSATSSTESPHSIQEHPLSATPVYMSLTPNPTASLPFGAAVVSAGCDPFGKLNLELCGSFTSLLNNTAPQAPEFLSFGGFGIGIGHGLEEVNLAIGRDILPLAGTVAGNSWHIESGEGDFVNGDCFSWPDLAISTPSNALK